MVRVFLLMSIALCLLSPFAQAQDAPHQHPDTTLVDGAVHPELIPDSVAYRLYFLTHSTGATPTQEDQKRQHAHLAKIGLEDGDLKILIGVLADFRASYDALESQYNHSAEAAAAKGEAGDIDAFLRQRDGLVQAARDTLKIRLTADGMLLFDIFVRSEKRHMKMHAEG
jgi:hypothetical protein